MRARAHAVYLLWGLAFGFVLSRSGAARFDYIVDMFMLRSFQLYGIMAGAIGVALPLFWWMKSRQRAKDPRFKGLHFPRRRLTPGTLPGAAIFGLGWALTGTCPGPAMVQVGEGHWVALATVAGVFCGNWLYERVHRRWFHWRPDSCA